MGRVTVKENIENPVESAGIIFLINARPLIGVLAVCSLLYYVLHVEKQYLRLSEAYNKQNLEILALRAQPQLPEQPEWVVLMWLLDA